MQNNIANLSIADLLKLGNKCATTALAIGQEVGLAQNKAEKIDADYSLAKACFLAVQAESANRVAKADALSGLLATTRTWCFRAKDTLKPYLGESHNVLYRPTGFVRGVLKPRRIDTENAGGLGLIEIEAGRFLTLTLAESKNLGTFQ